MASIVNKEIILLLILVLLRSNVSAGSATQNDWSGGSPVPGPVMEWGNKFCSYVNIDFITPFQLSIMNLAYKHVVTSTDFENTMLSYPADINGDGYTDIIGGIHNDRNVMWWENLDGTGTLWTEHYIDLDFGGLAGVCASDINNDGFMDVLGAAYWLPGTIAWWENTDGTGTNWLKHTITDDFSGAVCVITEDINRDGLVDVVGAAIYDGDIAWWENLDGTGTSWTKHNVDLYFGGATSVHSADINDDGFMDILGAAENADQISWWENIDGSGISWTKHLVDGDFNGAQSVQAGNFNSNDEHMDIVAVAAYDDDITWWENLDGSGTNWIEHPVDEYYDSPMCVCAEDINQDGLLDLITASPMRGEIAYWENSDTSPGTCWLKHTIEDDFSGVFSVSTGDIDGDGCFDLTASCQNGSYIAWWSMVGDGYLVSSVLDVQERADWQTINWVSVEPPGTDVAFQVRSSDDPVNMGPWSDTLSTPCSLEGIIADGDSLFQYKVILCTTTPCSSPLLESITVSWIPLTGIHEEPSGESVSYALSGARPNPASQFVTIVFSLPDISNIELTVFDVTGRVVASSCSEYQSGEQEVVLTNLANGLYLVRMVSEGFTATRQFIVLE